MLICSFFALSAIFQTAEAKSDFPKNGQKGKIAIVCHRGNWNADDRSQNSIAALKAAQENGYWGSECDIHLTKDGQIVVNHDPTINGRKISESTIYELRQEKLKNGEVIPTLDEYLAQASQNKKCRLIIEFKKQPSEEYEDLLISNTIDALKAHKMFKPDRVLFISFSERACEIVAEKYPKFVNQYLSSDRKSDKSPAQYAAKGINGIDYQYKIFLDHPEYVEQAHALGMSVNVWTVDSEEHIRKMIELGVDQITTNKPEFTRELLGDKEYK